MPQNGVFSRGAGKLLGDCYLGASVKRTVGGGSKVSDEVSKLTENGLENHLLPAGYVASISIFVSEAGRFQKMAECF